MFVPLILVLAVFCTRLLTLAGDLSVVASLSPIIALTLCGAAFFKHRWEMALPLVAFVVSDILINFAYGVPPLGVHTFVALAVYGGIAVMGIGLRGGARGQLPMLGATVAGVLAFYLVTNTLSFFMSPGYPSSIEGWIQCLTVGLPGYPPTWSFLLKSLVSNLVFTGIFCLVFHTRESKSTAPALVRGESTALS
ncbi:MAG: DUF6580 family putative transport protein [Verrucomicrobiales bacterium]